MPRSKRDVIKDRHTRTKLAIEKALSYVAELEEMFSGPHPDYAKGYESIRIALTFCHESITTMRKYI